MSAKVIVAEFGSNLQIQSIGLRYEILRKPLGLKFTAEELLTENSETHILAITDHLVCGCMLLKPLHNEVVKMRQVAVAKHLQSFGIGNAMVQFAEEWCRNAGYKCIELHARDTAVKFYLNHQYQVFGNPFTEVGIPHLAMKKDL
ncbi:MAG: GNAT family N-acetyltransferase [Bacteroidetes bacterium]|nr:GNAT family N-acetyltransferase [Bacteroidota bacterium]